jgi:hypothetical protein
VAGTALGSGTTGASVDAGSVVGGGSTSAVRMKSGEPRYQATGPPREHDERDDGDRQADGDRNPQRIEARREGALQLTDQLHRGHRRDSP